jgi:hypothetical protein
MPSNIIGIRNNNVLVPYSAATKRTKELSLVKTTDLTAATSGASLGTYLITRGVAVFYADSNNVWRMCFNIRMSCDSGTRQDVAFTFPNVVFKTVTGLKQAVAVGISAATEIGGSAYASASGSSNTIGAEHASTATTAYYISGDVELNAEPTTYTTAANMEGVTAVDVWIGPQVPGVSAGLVPAQGLDGRTDGAAVPAGKVGEVKQVFNTSIISSTADTWTYINTLSGITRGIWLIGYSATILDSTGNEGVFSRVIKVTQNAETGNIANSYIATIDEVAGSRVLSKQFVHTVTTDLSSIELRFKTGGNGSLQAGPNITGTISEEDCQPVFYAIRIG